MTRTFGAIDIGASGGRAIAGRVRADGALDLDVVHRFPNGVVERDGHLRWDLGRLLAEVDRGVAQVPEAESWGVSTWGVDYGLLDEDRRLLADPVAYRDDRTAAVIPTVHAAVPPERLYATTGMQFLPFNTCYQLAVDRTAPWWDRVAHVVLIPDLVVHHLTGALGTEVTNASTTGLLDARTGTWSTEVCERLGLDIGRFAPLDAPGAPRGHTATGTPVVAVGSHDTASAVVGVPAQDRRFAYVASGTWSLVGVELDEPVLTDAARLANFTNERGVDDRIRFLRNVGGLWLLQECMRTWGTEDLRGLLAAAADQPSDGSGPRIDVDDEGFLAPDDMPARIERAVGRALSPAATVRCILDSLADAYARTIDGATRLSGHPVDVVHVVGGGSQNELLCQLTANATGRTVLAGPVEATARGNLMVQARAAGAMPASLDELRASAATVLAPRRYEPT